MSQDLQATFPTEVVKKQALISGVYLGVIALVVNIASMYLLMSSNNFKIASMVTGGVTILIMIGLAAYFSVSLRKVAGGFWSFSQALKNIFIMLAVTIIISTLGSTAFSVINPEPQQVIFDKTINMTIETMEGLGVEDDLIDKQVADLEKTRDESLKFSVGQTIKAIGVGLIMYFVFALILAAILKRERPAFLTVDNSGDSAHPWQENK